MCGIAGMIAVGALDRGLLGRMADSIAHRGPDDAGLWTDEGARVGLVHRRLSIIDLSPSGHQPMLSASGRYAIVYNGEIYNHGELRAALEASRGGIAWCGHSDTEVLVEGIAAWGLEETLKRCVGMFALALWDRETRTLSLARDRFGEKPLYYGWVGSDFLFASELKAMRRHPGFDNEVNPAALRLFVSRTYVPAPLTIFRRIYKLPPGAILTVAHDAAATPLDQPPAGEGGIRLDAYWSYADVVREGLADPIVDEEEALNRLEAALSTSISGQAVADVPVGAFLSGGIDSSSVVALYQKHAPGRIKTFSIGFEEGGFDEAGYAKAVARHFGTDHHERYVSFRDAQAVIPSLPSMYDEPFADPSQIPTHLVSRFAREQVTVALSGDGGDELFGGYNRHVQVPRLWAKASKAPRPLRALAGRTGGAMPPAVWNRLSGLAGAKRPPSFGTKVQKGLRAMGGARGVIDIYESFLDEWDGISPLGANVPLPQAANDLGAGAPDPVLMMYRDAVSYLPDDVLCKVDRAAMAVSLETRVPFLDHRVAAVAARIPLHMKIRDGEGKNILRRLLYRHAPKALFERPKAGFAVPVGEWVRGPLRDWAEDLLDAQSMRSSGFFDPAVVHGRWQRHLRGEEDATHALWAVLMFEAWRRDAGSAVQRP